MAERNLRKSFFTTEEFLNRFFAEELACYPHWTPAVDIYEDNEKFIVEAELPGVREEDIEVKVEGSVLLISGLRKSSSDTFLRCHRLERQQGYFLRRFILSSEIDKEKISATLKDGILTVIIPKKREFIIRHIKVEGEE
ncbi:MAG: Hsp20/alpha crystallin family protein [Thermodesulfovibrionales bacterium]|nr:Hsp20/alpha crystallin family protein [Thermodesulfovibrionales bacterium]